MSSSSWSMKRSFFAAAMGLDPYGDGDISNSSTSNPTTTTTSTTGTGGGATTGLIPTLWHHFAELVIKHDSEEWVTLKERLANEIIHPIDLTFLVVLSSLSFLLVTTASRKNNTTTRTTTNSTDNKSSSSYLDLLIVHISQLARLTLVIYVVNCIVVIVETLGIALNQHHDHHHYRGEYAVWSAGLAKILYIGWAAQRFSTFKRYGLNKIFLKKKNQTSDGNDQQSSSDIDDGEEQEEDKTGRVTAIDRLIDGGIIACTFFITLDVLNMDLGMSGITSLFAFSSAGTLVIGLASQNLATMFVNGLLLTTSDRIQEGDYIEFKDTCGQITKIGWFQTTLRHYDEKIEVIPNSELGMQRVTNLSRVRKCRVKQTLRFPYTAVDKLDDVLPAILEEIKEACPKVITDGTAPLRAVWTDYKEDHISIMVEARFNLPCKGDPYWNNRHECLKAIYRACKKHDVELVIGLYPNGINK